ncbi:MAG: type II 3-dehydroquinate dehydratase [Candidatus Omnitrophota bacterium]|jgi:3-dehydroquinate dehydratase-2
MKTNKETRILVIHGPNLHLLGTRQPNIYGKDTLEEINKELKQKARKYKVELRTVQFNSEGDIVEAITKDDYDILIINPAAYTHTSVAIRDALLGVEKPAIEVHLSNIYKREDFRKKSLVSDVVMGTISGFGKTSYTLALEAAIDLVQKKRK